MGAGLTEPGEKFVRVGLAEPGEKFLRSPLTSVCRMYGHLRDLRTGRIGSRCKHWGVPSDLRGHLWCTF